MSLKKYNVYNFKIKANNKNSIYLGTFSDLNLLSKNKILEYHIKNFKDLNNKIDYADNFYEKNKKKIFIKLNQFLNINLKTYQWEIILGHSLRKIINVMYDRYKILSTQKSSIKNLYLIHTEESCLFSLDEDDLTINIQRNDWNNRIFQLAALYLGISFKLVKKNSKDKSKVKSNFYYLKLNIKKIFILFKYFFKIKNLKNQIIYSDQYFKSKLIVNNLITREDYFNYYLLYSNKINQNGNFFLRDKLKFNTIDKKKNFNNFFFSYIHLMLPTAYVENYFLIKFFSLKIPISTNIEKIVSSIDFFKNEFFKFRIANLKNKIKIYIIQHGGGIGHFKKYNDYLKHSLSISSKFLSWGIKRKDIKKIYPFYSNKIIFDDNEHVQNTGKEYDIIITFPPVRKYLSQITPDVILPGQQTIEFIKKINRLLMYLKKKKYKVALKFHPGTDVSGNNPGHDLSALFKKYKFKIFEDNIDLNTLSSSSKIIMHTYEGTPFFETISNGLKSILYLPKNPCKHVYPEYASIYSNLIKDKIILYDKNYIYIDEYINGNNEYFQKQSLKDYKKNFCRIAQGVKKYNNELIRLVS